MEPEMVLIELIFQSTLPAWGATRRRRFPREPSAISIHAPRMGSDVLHLRLLLNMDLHFNPRSPHGERLRLRA